MDEGFLFILKRLAPMLRHELQTAGFGLKSQGEEFKNGPTCTVEAFDIITPDGEVDATRDFADVKMTGSYPNVMGRFALNKEVDETVAVISGAGTLLVIQPNGMMVPQEVQAGDRITIKKGTGFQWQPEAGQTIETELLCEPPFTPAQYGYYQFDDDTKQLVLIGNKED